MQIAFAGSIAAQTNKKHDQDGIYGHAKTVTEYNYNVKTTDGKTEKDKLLSKVVSTYDSTGKIIESITQGQFGKEIAVTYGYDANGNLSEENEAGNWNYHITNHYDEKNRLVEQTTMAEEKFYTTNLFDSSNNIILETKHYDIIGNMRTLNSTTKYKYDEHHQCTVMEMYDEYNTMDQKITFKYDNYGNETEYSVIDKLGILQQRINSTYQDFDAKNNWLLKTTSENGKTTTITERVIEYQ